MHANVIDIKTPADWDAKVLKNPKPVIVDFYADWCGPCKVLKPKLHDAAAQANGKWELAVVNVDIEELGGISQTYASQGIPAVYLFNKGVKVSDFLGNNKAKAEAMIAQAASL